MSRLENFLSEVKAEHKRQITNRKELDLKYRNFLHFGGIILSVMLVGIVLDVIFSGQSIIPHLLVSSLFILISIVLLLYRMTHVKYLESFDLESLRQENNISEERFYKLLIDQYALSHKSLISEHTVRKKDLVHSMFFIVSGILFLIASVGIRLLS